MKLHEYLKEKRLQKLFNQEQMAKYLELSVSVYKNLELGNTLTPTFGTKRKICKHLRLSRARLEEMLKEK